LTLNAISAIFIVYIAIIQKEVDPVPKTIIVKDFPEDLHTALKVRAALEKMTMKDLIIRYSQEGLERGQKGKKKGG
jgi:hypothetical protein